MIKSILTAAAGMIFLSGCQQHVEASRPMVSPEAKVVGEPVSCLSISRFRETKIRDDWTVDFMRTRTQGWRNTLDRRCSGLKSADAITYRSAAGRLCRVDSVNVLQTIGGRPQRGASCGLGQFVPIEIAP